MVYGFTSCPDICPTLLSTLILAVHSQPDSSKNSAPQLLFYSIDAKRDTPTKLAKYVAYFDPNLIGLTQDLKDISGHRGLEKSLGIVYSITPETSADALTEDSNIDYEVAHGIKIYLINPKGRLSAILNPKEDNNGLPYFTVKDIAHDYAAVESHYSKDS